MLLACLSLCAALTGEPRALFTAERVQCVSRPEPKPCAPARVTASQSGAALQRARGKRDAPLAKAASLPVPAWSQTALARPPAPGHVASPRRNGPSRAPPASRLRD